MNNETVVYAINGYGDEGSWDIELYSTYDKAYARFKQYVEEFTDMFNVEVQVDNDWACYDMGNHHDEFWVEEVRVY